MRQDAAKALFLNIAFVDVGVPVDVGRRDLELLA